MKCSDSNCSEISLPIHRHMSICVYSYLSQVKQDINYVFISITKLKTTRILMINYVELTMVQSFEHICSFVVGFNLMFAM